MRKHVRTTAAAVALAAALALTGCSSDSKGGSDADAKDKGKGGSTGQSSPPPAGGAGAGTKDVAGTWTAMSGGKVLGLVIQGKDAAVAGADRVCSGTVAEDGGVSLSLKCPDGNTDRAKGTVTPSADGKTLTVKWEGSGITDSFKKSTAGDKLPEGVPTDMPKLPGS
ncbi:hypothetical protein ABCR94_31185 [Streptomyces sp. 21So2-11]|uniref:hypothetical protein n=1 Tax=Streptomyces sp. 21So2-11 TaxID=3144408 RepID=UPI00321AB012